MLIRSLATKNLLYVMYFLATFPSLFQMRQVPMQMFVCHVVVVKEERQKTQMSMVGKKWEGTLAKMLFSYVVVAPEKSKNRTKSNSQWHHRFQMGASATGRGSQRSINGNGKYFEYRCGTSRYTVQQEATMTFVENSN